MVGSMSEWKKVKLSDLGTIVGGATPSTKREEYYNGDISWITPKDLAGYTERYISRGSRNISQEGFNNCSSKLLPRNSILFSSRAPIGYVAISANELCTNQGFKSIVPNGNVDYMFMYYLLKYNKDRIEAMGSGTTFKEVSGKTMGNIEVNVPLLDTQKSMASVLSVIDDKIELNNRINNNLEQQAQAIFNDMFADNDKNNILSDIANIIMGQSPAGSSYNETGDGTVFYQGRAEFNSRFPKRRLFTTEPKRMAEENDILMSVRAPVGDINIAHERCCIGRGLSAIHSKTGHNSFLLYTMLSSKKELDVYNGEGTVFGSINRESLNNLPIFVPSSDLVQNFEEIVSSMDNIIRVNSDEIERLSQLRDILLPKLMSGEIDVSEVEI